MENAIWALRLDTRRGYVKAESSDFDRIVIRMPDLKVRMVESIERIYADLSDADVRPSSRAHEAGQ